MEIDEKALDSAMIAYAARTCNQPRRGGLASAILAYLEAASRTAAMDAYYESWKRHHFGPAPSPAPASLSDAELREREREAMHVENIRRAKSPNLTQS